MKGRGCTVAAFACLLVGAGPARRAPERSAPVLARLADIPLPGPAVRFDYQSIDTVARRLYISHMNAGEVIAFNLATRRVEGTVQDLPRVTGVLAVSALGKIYASVPGKRGTRDGSVAVIDARTLRVEARVGNVGFPDGIAYAPEVRKVYVSDESGGVIDGATDRPVTTIALGGEAGNTIYDQGSKRVLVAVQTRNQVAEIDPRTDQVTARHPLAGAAHPHGMGVDAARRLLFVADEAGTTLLTVDLRSMQVTDRHRVGREPDVLAFDPAWRRLYVASESGVVSVFTERDRRLVHDGDTVMAHAHTVAVDPGTHLVYFPLQDVGGKPMLRIMTPRRR